MTYFLNNINQGGIMGKFHRLYVHTYNLDENSDKEFFDCIKDYFNTDEVQSLNQYIQHGDVTLLQHVKSVSYISYKVAKRYGLDYEKAAKGAILHDLVYYDWHVPDKSHMLHGYRHPGFALKNATELSKKLNFTLSDLEKNIIHRHMFPLTFIPPKYKEAVVVSMVDKLAAIKEMVISSTKKQTDKFFSEVRLEGNRKSGKSD